MNIGGFFNSKWLFSCLLGHGFVQLSANERFPNFWYYLRNKSWKPGCYGLADISILSRADDNSSTCHIYFYDGKVSRIDGTSVTIVLCLHVLIARRILFILDMFIIFSEYRFYHLVNAILSLIDRSFVCKAFMFHFPITSIPSCVSTLK